MKQDNYRLYHYLAPEMGTDRTITPKTVMLPQQLEFNLYKDTIIELGELAAYIWYEEYDTSTKKYSKPIVKFEFEYVYDEHDGLPNYRVMTASWMLESGEWSTDTKTTKKAYSNQELRLNAIKRRRENIISWLKGRSVELGISGAITSLFSLFLAQIALYQESGSPALREAIMSTTDAKLSWLDEKTEDPNVSYRQYLFYVFSIGVNEPKTS